MIDVVYLAYFNESIGYGLNVVEKFLNSYNEHSAGVEHKLVIIAKNWKNDKKYKKLQELAKSNNAKLISLPDDGFDIGAYLRAAKLLSNEYVMFLGSNIEIEVDNWLALLYNAFNSDPSIQLVGPMGAWAKGISNKFPNPHIRTCAFIIKRDLFLEYAATQKFPKTKEDTYKIEHDTNSLSNYIFNKGYNAVVVNSDGKIFKKEDWPYSQTYFSRDASKLLMKDKWINYFESLNEFAQIKTVMIEWGKNLEKYPKNLINEFSEKINIFIPYNDIIDVISTKIYHPIFVGKINKKLETEALQASKGVNIAEKDYLYGEMTAYYWVWKNFITTTPSEYIGFCQKTHVFEFDESTKDLIFNPVFINNYKKTFEEISEEKILTQIKDYDIIVPEKATLSTNFYENALKSIKKEDFDFVLNLIKGLYPQHSQIIDEVMNANSMFLSDNFIMKKDMLNEFFEWLFNILSKIEEKIDLEEYSKDKDKDNAGNIFGHESFINIWLNIKSKNQNLKIKTQKSNIIYYDIQKYMQACIDRIQIIKDEKGI